MAEGGQTPAKSTPNLKELSNALDSVVDWYSLGVKLGLEDHELRTIDKNFHGDSERCKHEMLSRCLRNAKLPTWKAVADALCLTGEHTVAAKIRKRHCNSSTDTDTATPPVTSPQSPSAVAIAKRSVQKIKGRFSTLVTKSRRKLQNRKVDVDDVQTFLVTMYSSPDSKDGSDTVTVVVESARNLSEIFRALSKHRLWDYINYYLLQDMIEEFARDDDELNGMMEQYQKDLTGHILTLRIQTYLDATHDELPLVSTNDSENSDDATIPPLPPQQKYQLFKKLTGKIKANVTDHTLSYVTDLWRSLANQFALPRPAMILHDIAEGCISITWLIPNNLVKYVTRMAQETANMFSEEQILTVMLENQCIYPMEAELASEPTLLETEPSPPQSKPHPLESETTALKRKIEGLTGGRSPNLPAESTDGSRSWDLPVSGQDERENPEDIPEYELRMKGARVMRTNYSFLWQYLEPSRLLSILVDKLLMTETKKKEAESYTQKLAQNSVIIYELFASGCPPLKLCDTLDVTGQGHIARKLLQDYKHPTLRKVRPPSEAIAVRSDLSETSELFQQLQRKVMDLLDQFPNALAKLKQVLASLVLPLGEGKVAPIVDPLAYKNTQTVRELFRLMAPYWNPLSTDLLALLLEASGCNQAASKVAEFVEVRVSKGHLVLCIRQLPTLASSENDLDVADLETVHNAPLSELQSLHPAFFARLPEHKLTSTQTTVRISVEVDKPLLCIADYEEITTALSGFFTVPKAALVYAGCSKAPLVLCWLASHELVEYIRSTAVGGLSGHRLLAESRVTWVAIGDRIYKCPTIKEVELWEACQHGLVGHVHHLLMTGVSVNVTQFDGFSPLYLASQEGHDGIVEMLLQAGATVDLQNKNGFFPLYLASQEGHDRIVEMLLQAGATVDLQQKDGATALHQAGYNGHHKVVELLLGAGANPDLQDKDRRSPLYDASQKGHDGIVKMLLQAGATVDLQSKDGTTPLYTACVNGHLAVVECLIAEKADVNHQRKNGTTPLMTASNSGHPSVVRVLLQAGATINTTEQSGGTALHYAVEQKHEDVVKLLLKVKVDPNLQLKSGSTALHFAVDKEHEGIVELLLEANADPDLPMKSSQKTALMTAAKKGLVGIVQKLIQHGATINLTDKDGNTAYDLACFEGHTEVCQELLTQHFS